MAFLETPRFPDDVGYGTVGGASFKTNIVQQFSGVESRAKAWQYPLQKYDIMYDVKSMEQISILNNFFNAVGGRFQGFRFKDWTDYTSFGQNVETQDGFQRAIESANGVIITFSAKKDYIAGVLTQIRPIKKFVAGTVSVAFGLHTFRVPELNGVNIISTMTGQITFKSAPPVVITNITKGNPTIITTATTYDGILYDSCFISGVSGMTQINNTRRAMSWVGNTITYNIDSTSFSNYISGGTANRIPQSLDSVNIKYEFDVPVRFANDDLLISRDSFNTTSITSLPLVEIRV